MEAVHVAAFNGGLGNPLVATKAALKVQAVHPSLFSLFSLCLHCEPLLSPRSVNILSSDRRVNRMVDISNASSYCVGNVLSVPWFPSLPPR